MPARRPVGTAIAAWPVPAITPCTAACPGASALRPSGLWIQGLDLHGGDPRGREERQWVRSGARAAIAFMERARAFHKMCMSFRGASPHPVLPETDPSCAERQGALSRFWYCAAPAAGIMAGIKGLFLRGWSGGLEVFSPGRVIRCRTVSYIETRARSVVASRGCLGRPTAAGRQPVIGSARALSGDPAEVTWAAARASS